MFQVKINQNKINSFILSLVEGTGDFGVYGLKISKSSLLCFSFFLLSLLLLCFSFFLSWAQFEIKKSPDKRARAVQFMAVACSKTYKNDEDLFVEIPLWRTVSFSEVRVPLPWKHLGGPKGFKKGTRSPLRQKYRKITILVNFDMHIVDCRGVVQIGGEVLGCP